jgi:SAM-dependent methyltransferase
MIDDMTATDRDYVLGTHDEEIERLGLQHNVWRPRAMAAWQRAGFTIGQTLIDVGCGPGYATLDLAELVGPEGQIIAVDRSRRFLDVLDLRRRTRRINNVSIVEADLDAVTFDEGEADGAWCRWVTAFVPRPNDLLRRVARGLKPGAAFVIHEYFDYATWRVMPRSGVFEQLVEATIANWRRSGGEPDIGLNIPAWLENLGFEMESLTPIIDVISPRDYAWQWPKSFVQVGLQRLIELGAMDESKGADITAAFDEIDRSPTARMITPGVLEIIARKR